MKNLPMFLAIAVSMNAGVALAQKDNMPGHDNMPPGDHAEHDKKKKDADADKKKKDADKKKKEGAADKKKPPQ